MPRNLPSVFYNFEPIRQADVTGEGSRKHDGMFGKAKDVRPMFSIRYASYLLELEQSLYSVCVLIS